jgi:hypothetical protein
MKAMRVLETESSPDFPAACPISAYVSFSYYYAKPAVLEVRLSSD